jgi:hypothetical protein
VIAIPHLIQKTTIVILWPTNMATVTKNRTYGKIAYNSKTSNNNIRNLTG